MPIREKLHAVRQRLNAACARAGRDPGDVRIVVVTKTVGVDAINELIALGATDIGENRVQDAARKAAAVRRRQPSPTVTLHMIGHLQTNKAAQAVRAFDVIHSIDSLRAAQAASRAAEAQGKLMPVLLEVNVSGEESKYGFDPEAAFAAAREISALPGIRLDGLMTMAPLGADEPTIRSVFRGLRELRDRMSSKLGIALPHLSMGMSQDFEIAVEEGATMVRVGTAIVG
ncbi:MAG TPA: YggS family pyridoxal phosphate-dependent enzyme [Planctomycetota bacterium]|nr:YggS family pyridoxal phosphate-dependent enzyme [Planctomycetota bacterium]